MRTWLVDGDPDNWLVALRNKVWGVRETPRHTGIWRLISAGDRIVFYATGPVGGIIGMGTVTTKFRDESLLWPKEIARGHTIWPHRFGFEVDAVLLSDRWETDRLKLDGVSILVRGGFQRLGEDLVDEIVEKMKNTGFGKTTPKA